MSLSIKQALINQGAEGSTNKQRFRNWLSSEGRTIAEIIDNADISGGGSGGGGELVKTLVWTNTDFVNAGFHGYKDGEGRDIDYDYDDFKNVKVDFSISEGENVGSFVSNDTIYEIETVLAEKANNILNFKDSILLLGGIKNPLCYIGITYTNQTALINQDYEIIGRCSYDFSFHKSGETVKFYSYIGLITNEIKEDMGEEVACYTVADFYNRAPSINDVFSIPYKVYRLDIQ